MPVENIYMESVMDYQSIKKQARILLLAAAVFSLSSCDQDPYSKNLHPKWESFYIDVAFVSSDDELNKQCGNDRPKSGCAWLTDHGVKVCHIRLFKLRETLRHEIEQHCIDHTWHKLYQLDDRETMQIL